jgi:hypothetical protein
LRINAKKYGFNVEKIIILVFFSGTIFGEPVKDAPTELNLESPVLHVDKNDPPLFICHGNQDI